MRNYLRRLVALISSDWQSSPWSHIVGSNTVRGIDEEHCQCRCKVVLVEAEVEVDALLLDPRTTKERLSVAPPSSSHTEHPAAMAGLQVCVCVCV